MKPGGGRRKGAEFERWVAAQFRTWWESVEPDAKWARVPLSGGWANAPVRSSFRACGDVMTTSTCFPFCVEVKHREDIEQPAVFRACWLQAVRQADEARLEPLLVYRHNREPARAAGWGTTFPFAESLEVEDGSTVHLLGTFPLASLLRQDPRAWALQVASGSFPHPRRG